MMHELLPLSGLYGVYATIPLPKGDATGGGGRKAIKKSQNMKLWPRSHVGPSPEVVRNNMLLKQEEIRRATSAASATASIALATAPSKNALLTPLTSNTQSIANVMGTTTPIEKPIVIVFTKPSKDCFFGMSMCYGKGGVVNVKHIAPNSLFTGTDLKLGMTLLAVNGQYFNTVETCGTLLKAAEGKVTLLAAAAVSEQ